MKIMPAPRTARTRRILSALGVLAVLSGPAWAQAPAATPAPAPDPPRVDVGVFVDVYYGYNLNKVDPSLRTFDVQHNTFSLSLAELNFTRLPTADSRVGFRADLNFGKAADLTAAFEPAGDGKEIYKHIQQAYVSLLTNKVQWDAGKFVTPMGAEVIESQDNWNYTRSILFGYAIPFYHTGVRATITASPKVALGVQVVNGWNNTSENNGDKTFHFSATLKPTDKFTWIGNYMVGNETPGGSGPTRHLFDTTATIVASPKISVMANFDYGKEGDVSWWGIAGYGKIQATPAWALVARYEYLDDTDGGFMTFGTKAQSLTVTSDHLIAGGLKTRFEYRTDFADEAIFAKDDGSSRKSQTTLTVGLVYAFGGKI